ncbi:MAG: hypothetical protein LQ346_002374 [Caloplaca aetnensis]|nr:MAG: hypothetical protein LQ346_002374 [Caloplaca aetnensis]
MDNPNHDPALQQTLQQTCAQSPQDDSKSDATKRKRKDGTEAPTRAKRNRYISIACIVLRLTRPSEYRAMDQTIQALQDQVQRLDAELSAFRNPNGSSASPYPDPLTYPQQPSLNQGHQEGPYHVAQSSQTAQSPHMSQSPLAPSRVRHRRFQGPTSSAFNMNVANSSLQTMGLTDPSLIEAVGHEFDDVPPASPQLRRMSNPLTSSYVKDPIWSLGRDEAIRLCRVYDEEIGIMYPMLDIAQILEQASRLFTFVEAATRHGLVNRSKPSPDSMHGPDVDMLKMILATALFLEGGGQSELGSALFDTVKGACESKLGSLPDIGGLRLLVVMAYRAIGLAARLCFEVGLHRNHVLHRDFADHEEQSWALKLFWSIFVLDRRWSFGTGLPFAIQDADIDPLLPEPDGSTPYLVAMIAYSRIASKVWRSITAPIGTGGEIKEDMMGYLDYQVLQWQNTIPDSLRFYPTVDIPDTGPPSRAQRRLQVLLYLRMNQMRILIYRPVLHSATSIMENMPHARKVVDVAKDTIRVLSRLNQTTDIYRAQQVCFNHFLVSALAALFLAVSHAPMEFNQMVRDEFYMAIDLVRGFSAQSYVSMRLWQTIKGLKDIGPRLGLVSRPTMADDVDPHSSAAVAMAGLAGHRVNEMTAFPLTQGAATIAQSPMNGQQMSYELTNLFEAAGGYHNAIIPSSSHAEYGSGYVAPSGEANRHANVNGARAPPGNEKEFSKIMQALF